MGIVMFIVVYLVGVFATAVVAYAITENDDSSMILAIGWPITLLICAIALPVLGVVVPAMMVGNMLRDAIKGGEKQ